MWAFWEQSHLGTKPFGYNRWAFWVQWWALWVQWWALWVQWWAFWVQLTGPFGYILLGPLGTIYIRIINSVGLLGTIGGPFGYNSDSKERYMLGVFIANNTLLYCPKQSFMPISTCLTLRTPTLFNTLRTPRGGVHRTPPSISVVYQPIWMKFLHNVMYDISFPKNIGLALYDLYDVSYDVIMTF